MSSSAQLLLDLALGIAQAQESSHPPEAATFSAIPPAATGPEGKLSAPFQSRSLGRVLMELEVAA
jgi:hypothetical protein